MDTRNGMVRRRMTSRSVATPIDELRSHMALAGVYSSHWLAIYESMSFESICTDIGNRAADLAQFGNALTATEISFVEFGKHYW